MRRWGRFQHRKTFFPLTTQPPFLPPTQGLFPFPTTALTVGVQFEIVSRRRCHFLLNFLPTFSHIPSKQYAFRLGSFYIKFFSGEKNKIKIKKNNKIKKYFQASFLLLWSYTVCWQLIQRLNSQTIKSFQNLWNQQPGQQDIMGVLTKKFGQHAFIFYLVQEKNTVEKWIVKAQK